MDHATAVEPLGPRPAKGTLHASWLAARAGAVLSFHAAWVHFAYMDSHFREWWAYGAFFLAAGVGQAILGLLLLKRPRPWIVLTGLAGNLAIVGMYVLTRTEGIPLGPHARVVEHAGVMDMTATAAEVLLIGVLLVLLPPRIRRHTANVLLATGVLLWTLRLTGHLA
jgi:hypothetical protein